MEQTVSESRVMGIDYGEKRIGLALSDPMHTFAYPFITIPNNSNLLTELQKIIDQKSVTKIILGSPSVRFNSSQKILQKVLKFKNEIESSIKVDVLMWDEEFSSEIAKGRILQSVSKKSKRRDKSLLDKHSAAVILQEYLDSK